MEDFGKILVALGAVLVVVGWLVWRTGGFGGLGRLPGDIVIEKGHSVFYFPLVTGLILSVLLTLVSWFLRR